jgi:hypothetical protein
MKMGTISFPETTLRNYHYAVCNNLEEHSFVLLRGGSPNHATLNFIFGLRHVHMQTLSTAVDAKLETCMILGGSTIRIVNSNRNSCRKNALSSFFCALF